MSDTAPKPDPTWKSEAYPPLPDDALMLLPARQAVLFPGIMLPLTLTRPASIAAAQEAVRREKNIGVLLQRDSSIDEPKEEQLYRLGTAAEILRYVTAQDGTHHLICRGVRRFRILEFLSGYPFLVARVEQIGTSEIITPEIEARLRLLKQRAQEALQLLPNFPPEMGAAIEGLESPSALADFVAGVSDAKPAEKQEVLEAIDVTERLDKVLVLIAERLKVLRLTKEIGEQTQHSLSSQQRQHILREQLRQIQKELGEGDDKPAEIAELG